MRSYMLAVLSAVALCVASSAGDNCPGADFLGERSTEDERAQLARGQRDFSVRLMKALFAGSGPANVFAGPASIYQALTLAFFGATGETRDELALAMGFGNLTKAHVQRAYLYERAFQALREANDGLGYQLTNANRLYFDRSLALNSCIQLLLQGELGVVDFGDADKARREVNAWVEAKTRKKVRELVPAGSFSDSTRLALVNAAYFKGAWSSRFNASDTERGNFYVGRDDIAVTKFMRQKGRFAYYTSEELRAHILQMPYVGDSVSMVVILPPFEDDGLQATLDKLTPTTMQGVMAELRSGFYEVDDLDVVLPRFSIEQSAELRPILEALGIGRLFDGRRADLDDFVEAGSAERVTLSSAAHKAFIEVNEEGSEAAAATALFGFRSARPLFHTKFVANHPFAFFIYDNDTDNVLFFGVYRDPRKA